MTQEEKELLLKDLCTRLPYDVKVAFQVGNNVPDIRVFTGKDYDYLKYYHFIDDFTNCTFKPYLRSIDSSMTEEEDKKRIELGIWRNSNIEGCKVTAIDKNVDKALDWLNANHFDYRGLIPKGLAIEITEDNNPYKE